MWVDGELHLEGRNSHFRALLLHVGYSSALFALPLSMAMSHQVGCFLLPACFVFSVEHYFRSMMGMVVVGFSLVMVGCERCTRWYDVDGYNVSQAHLLLLHDCYT
jgi:hypothetical protein